MGGDDRRCAWPDGTGAGTRATMPLINEGRTVMESRMTPFLSASYRADEAVIYSAV